jgi:hypothetical protein
MPYAYIEREKNEVPEKGSLRKEDIEWMVRCINSNTTEQLIGWM